MTSLKHGILYQLKLTSTGNLDNSLIPLFHTQNRYRDIAANFEGNKIFIATDKFGQTSGPSGGNTSNLLNHGAILEFSSQNSRQVKGDFDFDSDVDKADLALMRNHFGLSATSLNDNFDINDDGIINVLDFREAVRLCSRPRCVIE